jgi:hypothetical protein
MRKVLKNFVLVTHWCLATAFMLNNMQCLLGRFKTDNLPVLVTVESKQRF